MNALLSLGRYLFALPFAIFGILHFMAADAMTGLVPSYLPAGTVWVYLSGLGLVAASVAILLGKYDKLGATALGAMLILFALTIHLPKAMAGDQGAVIMALKDFALAGAAWTFALYHAKDKSIIG